MPYDPLEPTPKDVIRGWAGDTDPVSEIIPDTTYVAVLVRHGAGFSEGDATDSAPFYRAAAEILRRVAVVLQADPSSISAPQDGSIGWGANRTKALEEKARELDAMATARDQSSKDSEIGKVVQVYSPYLTDMGDDWRGSW